MDEVLDFTPARAGDLPRIMELIGQAQRQMRLAGSAQWQDGYPAPEDIAADIVRGRGLTLRLCGQVVAYAAAGFDGEPAYESIDGRWLTPGPYVVVHRLAVADRVKRRGMGRELMHRIESLGRERGVVSIRVDTSRDNRIMLRLLDGMGYRYCGEIRCRGGLRRAYEKPLPTGGTVADDSAG